MYLGFRRMPGESYRIMFVSCLVLSRLDYCNSLLSVCPQYLLDKLQKVQNAALKKMVGGGGGGGGDVSL